MKRRSFVYLVPVAIGVFSLVTLGMSAYIYASPQAEVKGSQIERMLQQVEASPGNTYGGIYSLDGKPMMEHSFIGIVKEKTKKDAEGNAVEETVVKEDKISTRSGLEKSIYMPTKECYASVLGINNDYSEGILTNAKKILTMNTEPCNRINAIGDSITTTILSKPQEEAYAQLQDYTGICRWSTLVVLNSDGAILVDAASNSAAIQDYMDALYSHYSSPFSIYGKEPVPSNKLLTYYELGIESDIAAECVGSSFKPITARILQLNNDSLGELSIYRDDAVDNGFYELKENNKKLVIHNVDINTNHYPHTTSLSDAMTRSSNTYFLERVEKMGLANYLDQLNHYFFLNADVNSDVHTMPSMPFSSDDIDFYCEKISFGQEARIVPVRLANLYQHSLSGCYYTPFMIAQIRTPENEIIYHAQPKEREEFHFDVDMKNDIIVDSLRQTFFSYANKGIQRSKDLQNELKRSRPERKEELSLQEGMDPAEVERQLAAQESAELAKTMSYFPESVLLSGRILAKSGTAEKVQNTVENHTMVVTVLDEQQEHILYTAVLTVNYMQMKSNDATLLASQDIMAGKLLRVIEQIDDNRLFTAGGVEGEESQGE